MLSLSVGSRVKEIAVRKAIGAQQLDILRLILSEGCRMIVVGVFLGAVVAVLLGRALEDYLFGVTAADPASLAHGGCRVRRRGAERVTGAGGARRTERSPVRAPPGVTAVVP